MQTDSGWVKLHRRMLRDEKYHSLSPIDRLIFIGCIMIAEYDGEQVGCLMAEGKPMNLREIGRQLDIPRSSVERGIKRLSTEGIGLLKQTASGAWKVTNYERYQSVGSRRSEDSGRTGDEANTPGPEVTHTGSDAGEARSVVTHSGSEVTHTGSEVTHTGSEVTHPGSAYSNIRHEEFEEGKEPSIPNHEQYPVSSGESQETVLSEGERAWKLFCDLWVPMKHPSEVACAEYRELVSEHGIDALHGALQLCEQKGVNRHAVISYCRKALKQSKEGGTRSYGKRKRSSWGI